MAIGILVVDDDNDDLALFSEALNIVNPEVICTVAENGLAAIEYLNTDNTGIPAVIFLDINMPVMDGWDCISVLKSSTRLKEIPVFMYSTSSTKADKEKAIQMGAICLISKMQDFKSLKKMLEIVVHNLEQNTVQLICREVQRMVEI